MGIYVPTESGLTFRQFCDFEPDIEVLIGGQSDVKSALVPDLLDPNAFNYAETGESPIESYYKLRYHLPRMPRLRMLIYGVSLPSFVGVRKGRLYSRMFRRCQVTKSDDADLRRLGVSSPAMERCTARFKVTGKAELHQMHQNLKAAVTGRSTQKNLKGDLVRGYRASEGSKVNPERAVEMAQHHFEGGDPIDGTLLEYFERMLRLCNDRGITVVTVSPPVTDLYRTAAEELLTLGDLFAATVNDDRFSHLIDRHIDMTGLFETEYECFRDQNHLNARGAELATGYLVDRMDDLLSPGEIEGNRLC